MKILHTVEFYSPSVGGMQEIVKQVSERLAALGHQVTVATTKLAERKKCEINGVKIVEFEISGNLATNLSGEVESYRQFLKDSDFDVMTNFAAQQWATDVTLPILDHIKSKKVFVPEGFSGLYRPEFRDYFINMRTWMKKYDKNVFHSNDYRDINFARNCGVDDAVIIPNGASKDEFAPVSDINIRSKLGVPRKHLFILHVGSHTGVKGHSEAIELFSRAHVKNATFVIVGNSFGGGCTVLCEKRQLKFNLSPKRLFDGKKLIVISLSRSETVAAFKESDFFLFPSNIECSPLILFECMAAKIPFLTTDVGNAAEITEWSKGGRVLPTLKDEKGYCKADVNASIKMVEEFCKDSTKRIRMGTAGHEAWLERFTWEKIAKDYEKLYLELTC